MLARATGLFRIYRGTTENTSGDEVAADYPIASDVPLALHNSSVTEYPPNTATPRTINAIRGRAGVGTDLQVEDRIEDQNGGQRYVVDTISEPLSSTRNSDLAFTAHRVN
jgi:hypothetical protein